MHELVGAMESQLTAQLAQMGDTADEDAHNPTDHDGRLHNLLPLDGISPLLPAHLSGSAVHASFDIERSRPL